MDRHIFALLIIAMVMFASVMTARYRSLGKRTAAAEDPDAVRLREEVRTLKERIAVLERIATDKESSLEREIERLRDR
jgi:hypothetical protein